MNLSSISSFEELNQFLNSISYDEVAKITIEAFEIFVGANFTGYKEDCFVLPSFISDELARNEVSFGLNKPSVKASAVPYLYLCKVAATDRLDNCENIEGYLLAFRIFGVWQMILQEPSLEIKERIQAIIAKIDDKKLSWDEKARFSIEKAGLFLKYFDYDLCQESIERSLECAGLSVELAGKMGKRTRFQQKAVSQLVLSTESIARSPSEPDNDVPKNCSLNDDTLLEKVALLESSTEVTSLTSIQLAVLLAMCRLEIRTEFHDDVLLEKAGAYFDTIVSANRCWAVQAAALLLRSNLERKSKRKVERACSQSELISKLMRGIDDETEMSIRKSRSSMVLAAGLEPVWQAQAVNAEILRSLGCTSEALLIFESIEMWDSVIDCYKGLGQLEKAESLIRRLLEERPTDSMLYVYLGDITLEASYYEKAIEISSDRNSKARKSLGTLMLIRSQYEEAYQHLRRSLELQPIQLGVWFNAGFCAWKTEKYVDAATCYHRCVSLEPEHFEAWNNLSAAYIRQGQKERARRILQEALKYNFEHANVWENYLLLCVDTGEFNAAIQAFHRLLDLNKRQEDDEVLEILAAEILRRDSLKEETTNEEKTLIKNAKDELIKLLARITSSQTLSSKVWSLYARLKKPADNNIVEFEKYIQLLERAVLSNSNKPDWFKTEGINKETLENAILLASERLVHASLKGTEEAEKQAKGRIRLALKPMVTAVEKHYGSNVSDDISNFVDQAKELLTSISL